VLSFIQVFRRSKHIFFYNSITKNVHKICTKKNQFLLKKFERFLLPNFAMVSFYFGWRSDDKTPCPLKTSSLRPWQCCNFVRFSFNSVRSHLKFNDIIIITFSVHHLSWLFTAQFVVGSFKLYNATAYSIYSTVLLLRTLQYVCNQYPYVTLFESNETEIHFKWSVTSFSGRRRLKLRKHLKLS